MLQRLVVCLRRKRGEGEVVRMSEWRNWSSKHKGSGRARKRFETCD